MTTKSQKAIKFNWKKLHKYNCPLFVWVEYGILDPKEYKCPVIKKNCRFNEMPNDCPIKEFVDL